MNSGLNFYQKDAVEAIRKVETYQVCFVDAGGRQISDIQKIIADEAQMNKPHPT